MKDPNIEKMSKHDCHICMAAVVDVHHWRSRGSGGDNELHNLVTLCRRHHNEFHTTGEQTFWKKYKIQLIAYRKMYDLPPIRRKHDD